VLDRQWWRRLDNEDRVTERTELAPIDDLHAIIGTVDRTLALRIDPGKIPQVCRELTSCYPNLAPHDVEGYAMQIARVFAEYPESTCRSPRVLSPVHGLPGRMKFPPTTADLNEALAAEVKRLDRIRANARWHLQEHARRRDAELEAARYDGPSAADRAAVVRQALGR